MLSAEDHALRMIAERLGVTQRTVSRWRRRYQDERLAGLKSRPRSGRPRRISRRKELVVVTATMRPPKHATRWSTRRLAKEVGRSFMTGHRSWRKWS